MPLCIVTEQDKEAVVDKAAVLKDKEAKFPLDTTKPFKLNAGTFGVCAFAFYTYYSPFLRLLQIAYFIRLKDWPPLPQLLLKKALYSRRTTDLDSYKMLWRWRRLGSAN